MQYKSEKQKEALQKQANYLKEFNKLFSIKEELEIRNLYISGLSCNEIAKQFNCSKTPILRIIKDLPKRKAHDYSSHKSKNQYGENNPSWKGGIKSIYDRFRGLLRYWNWHNDVLVRDGNKCTNCNSIESLEVHHKTTLKTLVIQYSIENNKDIKDFTENDLLSDYFYSTDNGVTYCKKCHKDWHKIHGR